MKPDKGLTVMQEYLRLKATEATHLFCSVCKLEPPRWKGGPCRACEMELGAS